MEQKELTFNNLPQLAEEAAEEAADGLQQKMQQLIDDGNYLSARKLLISFTTRCAEWNYLFGAVLMKTCEGQKALIYLSVAAHQQPENAKYARALKEAERAQQGKRRGLSGLLRRR